MNLPPAWPFEIRGSLGRQDVAHLPRIDLDPSQRRLRVFAQDPTVSRQDGAIHTVSIPNEPLQPGPRGAVLVVEDIDEDLGTTEPPVDLDAPAVLMEQGLPPSSSKRQFMQQMVYAVGMETYSCFIRALGRDPGFGPLGGEAAQDGRLRIRPHAFQDANAYYDRETGALKFGFDYAGNFAQSQGQPGGHVFTALSRDIVAHEMSHALLDGLRPNFLRPTHPDVDALHEGFADLVAVFLRFSQTEVVERALERTQGGLRDNLLADIGRQFGYFLVDGRAPLRTAIITEDRAKPIEEKHMYHKQVEAHDRGAVLVSAVFDAFMEIFERRTRPLKHVFASYQGRLPAEGITMLAREASSLAHRFLGLVIRAIDYCPPLHCTFGEYLRAGLTADRDLAAEDPTGYRDAITTSFRRFGITVPEVPDLSEESLAWRPPASGTIVIPALRFENLGLSFAGGLCDWPTDDGGVRVRRAAQALGETICTQRHAHDFGLVRPGDGYQPPRVVSLRTLRRVSPELDVHFDLVAEVVQKRKVREGWFLGGSTIVVSTEGVVRYAITKHVDSAQRLREQRAWLETQPAEVRAAAWDEHSIVAARLQRRLHLWKTARRAEAVATADA